MLLEAGTYTGTAKLWFEPTSAPMEDPFTFTVEPVAGGVATMIRSHGKHGDDASEGIGVLSQNKRLGQYQLAWLDSFHMADEPMALAGASLDQLLGTYYWEGQPHGWRIAIAQPDPDTLEWRMYNRMEGIPEYLGVEAILTRA